MQCLDSKRRLSKRIKNRGCGQAVGVVHTPTITEVKSEFDVNQAEVGKRTGCIADLTDATRVKVSLENIIDSGVFIKTEITDEFDYDYFPNTQDEKLFYPTKGASEIKWCDANDPLAVISKPSFWTDDDAKLGKFEPCDADTCDLLPNTSDSQPNIAEPLSCEVDLSNICHSECKIGDSLSCDASFPNTSDSLLNIGTPLASNVDFPNTTDSLPNIGKPVVSDIELPNTGDSLYNTSNSLSHDPYFPNTSDSLPNTISNNENELNTAELAVLCSAEIKPESEEITVTPARKRRQYNKVRMCEICGRMFDNYLKLGRHMKHCHGPKPYRCADCDFAASMPSRLSDHIKRRHTDELPYRCTECNFTTMRRHGLTKHVARHSREPSAPATYTCYTCGKQYTVKKSLISHMLVHIPKTSKLHICDRCGYRANHAANLRDHLMGHTGIRPFECELCDKKFYKQNYLRDHMTVHVDDRPFICTQCGLKFKRRGNLLSHTKLHSGYKPFKCSQCEYTCVDNRALKRHLRIHTGEKPYACMLCDYRATQKGSIKLHMKVHVRKFAADMDAREMESDS